MSEVHAPLTGARPSTGNPGSATSTGIQFKVLDQKLLDIPVKLHGTNNSNF